MKKRVYMFALMALAPLLTGCSSAFYASSNAASDDLYAVHNRTEIARKQQAEAEARKAEAEARKAEWEAMLAEAAAKNAETNYYSGSSGESYSSVLANDYESAYARRLRGFESPTYKMPSSYTNARYSSTFHYVSAYDPAFYNIIVMGDEMWVEPKYVTAMFGSWGLPSYSSAWYYGWNGWPSYSWWGYPSFGFSIGSWGWNFGFSWYDPWYYPYYGPYNPYYPYHPYYYPYHHHHHHYPHHPGWGPGGHHHHHGPAIVHRPSHPRGTQTYRPQGSNVNRTQQGGKQWNSGVYQGGGSNNRRGSGTVNRNQQGGRNNAGSTQNSWSNSNNSQRRSSQSGSSQRNYNSNSNSNSRNYSSGYSGGGSYGGGGGSSRGGYSGSSSRGR